MSVFSKSSFASGGQGDSFRENRPPGPVKHPQKLLIKGGHSLQTERIFVQTMTAFGFTEKRAN